MPGKQADPKATAAVAAAAVAAAVAGVAYSNCVLAAVPSVDVAAIEKVTVHSLVIVPLFCV